MNAASASLFRRRSCCCCRVGNSRADRLLRIEDGLVHVERHADDDLDADGGEQVLVYASPVIL